MSVSDLSMVLQERKKELGISMSELSRRSSLSRQTLYNILDGEVSQARLTSLTSIANALELHPLEILRSFFKEADFPKKKPMVRNKRDIDEIGLINDVTYPDYSIVPPNKIVEKTWEVRNIGNVIWENRKIVCADDLITVSFTNGKSFNYGLEPVNGSSIAIPKTYPNQSIKISVKLRTPDIACTTISMWKMVDEKGNFTFPETTGLYCLVKVLKL